ncbi:hypothetical protein ACH3VR_07415 [Microbacterium sp. B2969]|uniref:Uncharacterized protein n=1 Tax=Microbacterium alkaliflavum TaxID=3248839 RepID=A0ABW7Q5Q4_9MICO
MSFWNEPFTLSDPRATELLAIARIGLPEKKDMRDFIEILGIPVDSIDWDGPAADVRLRVLRAVASIGRLKEFALAALSQERFTLARDRLTTLIADGDRAASVRQEVQIGPPSESSVAFGYETVMNALESARWAVSPTTRLRAADACETALDRLGAAARLLGPSEVAGEVITGLGFVSRCLAVERAQSRRKLADPAYQAADEDRDLAKTTYYAAYQIRQQLRETGMSSPAEDRSDGEADAAAALLGYPDAAAYDEYLNPSLKALLANPDMFTSTFLGLLRSGSVDVSDPDYTSAISTVQAKMYDLVNALVREGWARFETLDVLTLTQLGRSALERI